MFKPSTSSSNNQNRNNRFRSSGRGRGRGPSSRGGPSGRGRAPYGRRGRNGFRKKVEDKPSTPKYSTFKYPKTVEEFKSYVAPGSLKWLNVQQFENQLNKEVKLNPNDNAEPVDPMYLPHCFGKLEKEHISSDIARANEMTAHITSGGTKFSWISNKMKNNLDNTRRGKRYYAHVKYMERREKNKKIFANMQIIKQQNKNVV